MSLPGGWELVLIIAVIVLLFGAKKLPDAARSLGRSMRIFKSEIKEMNNDDQPQAQAQPQQQITNGGVQAPNPAAAPIQNLQEQPNNGQQ
ncbi:Sec-independent protein translocase subunit TatA [Corynebacterium sp. SCR221107]|uniref:Sec-independent protein translocase subunit TatA n=1 Tax=Corynebacterium sp. SCR221107 TaxID=3017361 RepID=UPI0022EC9671|nr:Sec-independent protein translocase subunit TatA [Corynebacterium sp. SCR221107]WBT07689.1 Sec-independent protein translocase subunit TatA [Corynebacterium sp. SCR221107]